MFMLQTPSVALRRDLIVDWVPLTALPRRSLAGVGDTGTRFPCQVSCIFNASSEAWSLPLHIFPGTSSSFLLLYYSSSTALICFISLMTRSGLWAWVC